MARVAQRMNSIGARAQLTTSSTFTNYQNPDVQSLDMRTCVAPISLAAPSTPDEARTEVIARAEAGEKLPVAEVKRIVDEAKGKPARKPPPAPTSAPTPPADVEPSPAVAPSRLLLGPVAAAPTAIAKPPASLPGVEPLSAMVLREWRELAPCLESFTRHSPGQIAAAVSNADPRSSTRSSRLPLCSPASLVSSRRRLPYRSRPSRLLHPRV